MMKVSIPMSGYEKCRACSHVFAESEPYTVVVVAGSAWKNGVAIIENKAELYRAYALCEQDKDWSEIKPPLEES